MLAKAILLADDTADSTLTTELYRPVVPLGPGKWEDITTDKPEPPEHSDPLHNEPDEVAEARS